MATASSRTPNRFVTLCLAWLTVSLPLLWGVGQTVKKALPLFQ